MRLRPPSARAFLIGWLSLFTLALVRTAWVSDDAYYTFRTIDNFVHGYGLRWNAVERVQVYTHPLWLALVTPFYAVTGEAFFTVIAISIVLTLVALWWLIEMAPSLGSAAVALSVLLLSRAFVDYSTSGLENPLTNILLVFFFAEWLFSNRRPFVLGVLACLLMLNRLDAGLLVLPALLVAWPWARGGRGYAMLAAAFLPLVAWELFSLLYYGFPFPNTAYAKLRTGIPEHQLLAQGFRYFLDSTRRDPLTLVAIVTATTWSLVDRKSRMWPIGLGIALEIAYVTWIGGDFMSGRMFESPLLLAVIILIGLDVGATTARRLAFVAVAVVVGGHALSLLVGRNDPDTFVPQSGVADERLYYFASSGLVNYSSEGLWPNAATAYTGLEARARGTHVFAYCCNGVLGYYAGPDVYVFDTLALGNPMLARLPVTGPWRIGHFYRDAPSGLIQSIEAGSNYISEPGLAEYYDRLSLVIRSPIWSVRRLRTILTFNTGGYEPLLRGRFKVSE